jgi:diguanylate cyclase (GGDEF)-like protein
MLRDTSDPGNERDTQQNETQLDQFAGSASLSRALNFSRRQLSVVRQQKADLQQQCSLLTEKVFSLESALTKATQFAHFDELTGLPNRRLLLDRFAQAAALANRHRQFLALLFFDVNDFKLVNDKLGHNIGDKLLQQVATRLSSSIRKSDTACRYGGDEFVVLLTEIADDKHLVKVLKKVRAKLAPTYVVDRYYIRLSVSDGLAVYPKDGQLFTDLLQLADRSMYCNKVGSRRQSVGASALNIWSHDAACGAKL